MRGECWGAHCLVTLLFLAEGNAKSSLRLWLSKKLNWLGWWLQLWNSKRTFCTSPLPNSGKLPAVIQKGFLKSCPGFSPKMFLTTFEFFLVALLVSKGSLSSQFIPSPKHTRSYLVCLLLSFLQQTALQTSPGTSQLPPPRQASALRGRGGHGAQQQWGTIKPGTRRKLSP